MNRYLFIFCISILACDTGNLQVVMDIPSKLKEVSGIEIDRQNDLLWMINDSGNKAILYGLDLRGKIVKRLEIKAKNRDWEDLASDEKGSIFIGDFGNNGNDRKNLSILKVSKEGLTDSTGAIDIARISFYYPNQKKFPPKKIDRHFDCESLLFFNDSLYLFTKSRAPKDFGRTDLYKIPATAGHHKAKFISSFNTCSEYGCWVTAADINQSGNRVVLLTEHSAFLFSDFKGDDFFSGTLKKYDFEHLSQKESICFKNDSTLYIADERSSGKGGNLYEFKMD